MWFESTAAHHSLDGNQSAWVDGDQSQDQLATLSRRSPLASTRLPH
jgi:hypothetical protein